MLTFKTKALKYEKTGKSRTFLVCTELDNKVEVVAYFTLAIQVLNIPETFSGNQIKNLDGLGSKINGELITEIPAILIGQIGKNDLHKDRVKGSRLMQYCMSTVLDGQARLGCRNLDFI